MKNLHKYFYKAFNTILLLLTIGGFVITYMTKNSDKVSPQLYRLKAIRSALLKYKKVCGKFPTKEEGLDALVVNSRSKIKCSNFPSSGFLTKITKDDWGNEVLYNVEGNNIILKSLGADGKIGGTEEIKLCRLDTHKFEELD